MSRTPSYRALVEATWERNILFNVLVELTYRCNLDCFFCYNDRALGGRELSTREWLRFFGDLAEMQVLNLTLSGGEPLAHPDFFRLGSAARELGFALRIKTNGHAVGASVARRLRDEVDPFNLDISLHGASPGVHDRQTRVPGSFHRLMGNLEAMRAAGLRVRLNSTLTRWNEHELEGMFALADELALPLQVFPEVTPRDDGDLSPTALAPSREAVARLWSLLDRHCAPDAGGSERCHGEAPPSSTRKSCGAGSGGIAVDPVGNVLPCVQWRRPVGNLHRQSIKTIWAQSQGLAAIRDVTSAARDHRDRLARRRSQPTSFCPALAEALTGDPFGVYPSVAPDAGAEDDTSAARRLPVLRSTTEPRPIPDSIRERP